MTDDWLSPGDGRPPMRVHAWVDAHGRTTTRELAIGAVCRDADGGWWAVPFAAYGLKPVLEQ